MHDDDLRDLFAAFAMISLSWVPHTREEHAKNCYDIADVMIAEKEKRRERDRPD